MKVRATSSRGLGRREHRLIPCGFAAGELDSYCKTSAASRLGAKENLQLNETRPSNAPLQFVYLHQRDAGMIRRYRAWIDWLTKGRTRDVQGELIAMGGHAPAQALALAAECDWQFLIYEPPGYPPPESPEVQP